MDDGRILHWDAPYEIVLRLKDLHPDIDLDTVGLGQLFDWIIGLPEFADDPALANDAILTDILREWYEEITIL
jgi:FeS assembly protein IscX